MHLGLSELFLPDLLESEGTLEVEVLVLRLIETVLEFGADGVALMILRILLGAVVTVEFEAEARGQFLLDADAEVVAEVVLGGSGAGGRGVCAGGEREEAEGCGEEGFSHV
jgi:hypothetical protein